MFPRITWRGMCSSRLGRPRTGTSSGWVRHQTGTIATRSAWRQRPFIRGKDVRHRLTVTAARQAAGHALDRRSAHRRAGGPGTGRDLGPGTRAECQGPQRKRRRWSVHRGARRCPGRRVHRWHPRSRRHEAGARQEGQSVERRRGQVRRPPQRRARTPRWLRRAEAGRSTATPTPTTASPPPSRRSRPPSWPSSRACCR